LHLPYRYFNGSLSLSFVLPVLVYANSTNCQTCCIPAWNPPYTTSKFTAFLWLLLLLCHLHLQSIYLDHETSGVVDPPWQIQIQKYCLCSLPWFYTIVIVYTQMEITSLFKKHHGLLVQCPLQHLAAFLVLKQVGLNSSSDGTEWRL